MPYKHTNEEARKLCIEALRSGKYQQGKEVLCQQTLDERLHCCLGVFCEVYSQHEEPLETHVVGRIVAFEGNTEAAPQVVTRWLGLRNGLGMTSCEFVENDSLAHRNDTGHTFDQIADFMEQHPDQVFARSLPEATPDFIELPTPSEAP